MRQEFYSTWLWGTHTSTAPTAMATRPRHPFPAGILLLAQDSQEESQVSSYHVTAHHDSCWLLQAKVPECSLASISTWVFVRSLVSRITSMTFLPAMFFTFIFPGSLLFFRHLFLFKNPSYWHQLFFPALQALSFLDLNCLHAEVCDQTPNPCFRLMFLLIEELRTRHLFSPAVTTVYKQLTLVAASK